MGVEVDKKKKVKKQEGLDELQAAWVVGKQKGDSAPLKRDELVELLESGRVELGWLGQEERKLIGKNYAKEKAKFKSSDPGGGGEVARGVVIRLMRSFDKKLISMTSKEKWQKMSEEKRDGGRRLLFYVTFGKTPEDYMENVKLAMSSVGGNGE